MKIEIGIPTSSNARILDCDKVETRGGDLVCKDAAGETIAYFCNFVYWKQLKDSDGEDL